MRQVVDFSPLVFSAVPIALNVSPPNSTAIAAANDTQLWLRGAALALLSIAVSSCGQTLQRYAYLKGLRSNGAPIWQSPLWWCGVVLYILASPLDLSAFYYAPVALVAVLQSLKLPFVTFLAWWILKARISTQCGIGLFLSAFGAVLALIFAPQSKHAHTLSTPTDLLTQGMNIYLASTLISWNLLIMAIFAKPRSYCGVPVLGKTGCAVAILAAWVYQLGRLFNAAMGQVQPASEMMTVKWIWMPGAVLMLGIFELYLNLAGVVVQSTHIFLPMVGGFGAAVMGFQSTVLLQEFSGMPLKSIGIWTAGIVLSVIGTVVIASSSSEKGAHGEDIEETQD